MGRVVMSLQHQQLAVQRELPLMWGELGSTKDIADIAKGFKMEGWATHSGAGGGFDATVQGGRSCGRVPRDSAGSHEARRMQKL